MSSRVKTNIKIEEVVAIMDSPSHSISGNTKIGVENYALSVASAALTPSMVPNPIEVGCIMQQQQQQHANSIILSLSCNMNTKKNDGAPSDVVSMQQQHKMVKNSYTHRSGGIISSQQHIDTSSKRCNNSTTGRWTPQEHEAFLEGLKTYGREWKKVAKCIPTRTSAQIRSHAQKYFAKIDKEQKIDATEQRRLSITEDMPSVDSYTTSGNRHVSSSLLIQTIMRDPTEIETRVCRTLASLRERYKHLEGKLQQQSKPHSVSHLDKSPASLSPATMALEMEQKSLREAAKARYEVKRLKKIQSSTDKFSTSPVAEKRKTPCAFVSLASLPSQGSNHQSSNFDSNDVLALSKLSGNFSSTCKDRIENTNIRTIKDEKTLKLIRDRLQLVEHGRPKKLRKVQDD